MKTVIFSQISIDGKITLGAGNSSKGLFDMFSTDDMRYIHNFRGSMDGIMVGRKTVEADNPFLTNRFEQNRNPVRIVPTNTMDIALDANIFKDGEKTIIVTTENCANNEKVEAIRKLHKNCIVCGKDTVDFKKLFQQLEGIYSIHSIMVEGGGRLNWSLINEELVDEIVLMQLPVIIGGANNISLVDGDGYTHLPELKRYELREVQPEHNYTLLRYTRM